MKKWDESTAEEKIHDYGDLSTQQRRALIDRLNHHFPPERYESNRVARLRAAAHMAASKNLLDGARQHYPAVVNTDDLKLSIESLRHCAVLLTAGGEGERLRVSLRNEGVSSDQLRDFTKATFPLPGFFDDFGTLQTNLAVLAQISREHDISIPVIVGTGPQGSTTARVIPAIVENFRKAGLPDAVTVAQDERLHLTEDEKIAWQLDHTGAVRPITHPDETGGPIMRLKQPFESHHSLLARLKESGCKKVLVLQATALYDTKIIRAMAQASQNHDCVGVGILRDMFPEDDPYGTFVDIQREDERKIHIIEQGVRNEHTRMVRDPHTAKFLPYNTGFYAFDIELLEKNDLPDYATPPKEILPELARTPKVGYAATDLLPLADNPVILAVSPDSFAVIKNAADLPRLSSLADTLGLKDSCEAALKLIRK